MYDSGYSHHQQSLTTPPAEQSLRTLLTPSHFFTQLANFADQFTSVGNDGESGALGGNRTHGTRGLEAPALPLSY